MKNKDGNETTPKQLAQDLVWEKVKELTTTFLPMQHGLKLTDGQTQKTQEQLAKLRDRIAKVCSKNLSE